jgi:uncharacterized membrane protein YvbJ
MQCTNCGAELQAGATVCPSCEHPVVVTKRAADRAARATGGDLVPKKWQLPALILMALVALGLIWWVVSAVMSTTNNTPAGAATRMMAAYGAYDAQGILDNVTHNSLTPADITAFKKQVTDGKAKNNGKPWVKDVKVVKTTIDPKDASAATVQLTEQILDTAKGTYSARNELLSLTKVKGVWLVRLY